MKTPIKKSHTDPETEFGDRHRVRRFKQVAEHYRMCSGMNITQEATTGTAENPDNGLITGSSPVVGTTLN